MFLSIIIPVYNTEKYLSDCLESCIAQDISSSDYEIICVNDGSTDGSAHILNAYASNNTNIIVITQDNAGVSAARNAGLKQAKGDYIWFVDSDDIIQINCLRDIKEKTIGYDLITVEAYMFHDELTDNEKKQIENHTLTPNLKWQEISVCLNIISRKFIEKNSLSFYEKLLYDEDCIFMNEFLRYSPKKYSSNIILYFYRIHGGSSVRSLTRSSTWKRLDSHIYAVKIFKEKLVSKSTFERYDYTNMVRYLHSVINDLSALPYVQIIKKYKELKSEGVLPFKVDYNKVKGYDNYYTYLGGIGECLNYIALRTINYPGIYIWKFINYINHVFRSKPRSNQ